MAENYDLAPRRGTWTDLEAKVKGCRQLVLIALILTVVNIVFVLFGLDVQLVYSMSVPYYFVVLGKGMDNHFTMGTWSKIGIYTRTGLVMAVVILGLLAFCWYRSRKNINLLKWLLAATILDAVAMLVMSATILGGLTGSILDMVVHGILIWQVAVGIKANKQLEEKRMDYCTCDPENF